MPGGARGTRVEGALTGPSPIQPNMMLRPRVVDPAHPPVPFRSEAAITIHTWLA